MSATEPLRLAAAFLALLLVSGCCLHRLDLEEFRTLPIDAQVATYERARRDGCVSSEHLALLSAMSRHGAAGADAMAELLRADHDDFPVDDIATVLRYTRNRGTDLRQHPALAELRRRAAGTDDPELRQTLEKAISELETPPPRH